MEGVTEPCFRDLVLARNDPRALGGAFTEFLRVIDRAPPERALRAHLGPARFEAPVGLQLMGADLHVLAETAVLAVAVGAPLLDLNFGCPSKGALRGCAGSALLDDPAGLERVVRACSEAIPGTPVTAKIRAGGEDDDLLEDLASAAEAGGAAMLTVHCRTRSEGYADTADWARLARAVAAVSIPVCGNGGVRSHADLSRLRAETGCAHAMVGRAALGDPWIFTGRAVDAGEAAAFLLEYADALRGRGASERAVAGRVKQLIAHWTAGELTGSDRRGWLRERDPAALLDRLRTAGADSARDGRGRDSILPRPPRPGAPAP